MSEFANGAERSALHWLARFRGTCQRFKFGCQARGKAASGMNDDGAECIRDG